MDIRVWEAHGTGWEEAIDRIYAHGLFAFADVFRISPHYPPGKRGLVLETFTKQREPFDETLARTEIDIAKKELATLSSVDARLESAAARITEFHLLLDYGTGAVSIASLSRDGEWWMNEGAMWEPWGSV